MLPRGPAHHRTTAPPVGSRAREDVRGSRDHFVVLAVESKLTVKSTKDSEP